MKSKYFTPLVEKPLVDPKRLSPRDKRMFKESGIKAFPNRGFGGGKPLAPKPTRSSTSAEKVLEGDSNASITLGTDRPGGLTSGLGGQGIPAASIDLVAGHMGAYARETDEMGEEILYNPNFQIDPARVYIAEATNIDENMQLPEGSLGSRNMSSAVGIMADDVNIQAKGEGGIKIAAHPTNRNSQGQKNVANPGIDLLVGGGTDQQPMVKGDNLLEALSEMAEQLDEVRGTVEQFVRLQGAFNDKVMTHNHNSPFWGSSTTQPFSLLYEGYKQAFQRVATVETGMIFSIVNKETSQNNYFNPVAEKYILSGLVTTG